MGRTKQLFEELRQKELQVESIFLKENNFLCKLKQKGTVTTAPNIK
tara:strand:+ start:1166 stop:1303 length:138 start_codon:yes stop_codon:yes gene_type:complete